MVMSTQSNHSLIEKKQRKRTTPFIGSVCFLYCDVFQFDCRYYKYEVERRCRLFNMAPRYKNTLVIHNIRMPRMIGGLLIGAALAVAGLFMQAMTRNPLASPQIFGVNAGASFVIVVITVMFPALTPLSTLLALLVHLLAVVSYTCYLILQRYDTGQISFSRDDSASLLYEFDTRTDFTE